MQASQGETTEEKTPRGHAAMNAQVAKRLNAGSNGTKRYWRQYGDDLVCVRYRQDDSTRYATVEIVVDKWPRRARPTRDGTPEAEKPSRDSGLSADAQVAAESAGPIAASGVAVAPPAEELVGVRMAWVGPSVRELAAAAGGIWDQQRCVWLMRRALAEQLGLANRVVFSVAAQKANEPAPTRAAERTAAS